MTARAYFSQDSQVTLSPIKKRRSLLLALLIVSTLGYIAWLALHYIARPDWLSILPSIILEIIALVQAAAAITIGALWFILIWRRRKVQHLPAAPDLESLHQLTPADFERYVGGLFRRHGYRVKLRGRSGDHGVDLEVTQRGGRRAIVQCKRYRHTIGPDIVRELYGTMIHENVHHAFLVTTADISDSARLWARHKAMTLIDGPALINIGLELQTRP